MLKIKSPFGVCGRGGVEGKGKSRKGRREVGRRNKIKIIHLTPFLLSSLFCEGDWKRQKAIISPHFKENHTLQIKKMKSQLPSGKH